jgi:hypothetical protein
MNLLKIILKIVIFYFLINILVSLLNNLFLVYTLLIIYKVDYLFKIMLMENHVNIKLHLMLILLMKYMINILTIYYYQYFTIVFLGRKYRKICRDLYII